MPQGNPNPASAPLPIEVVSRESITRTVLDVLPLLNSTDPASWALAAQRLGTAHDVARVTSKTLTVRARRASEAEATARILCPVCAGCTCGDESHHGAPLTPTLLAVIYGGRR